MPSAALQPPPLPPNARRGVAPVPVRRRRRLPAPFLVGAAAGVLFVVLVALVGLLSARPRVSPAAAAAPPTPAPEAAAADTWDRPDAPDGNWETSRP